jgi:hypothetical protein
MTRAKSIRAGKRKATSKSKQKAAEKEVRPATAGRISLKDELRARSGVHRRAAQPAPLPVEYPIGKGRKALKGIAIYMHPLAKEVLDKIAREHERTVQELGLEALNLLFRHYGEKPLA